MQQFINIPDTDSLTDSREKLLNNDITSLSCSAGTAFPTTDLVVGMLCFRTDEQKLYQLINLTTWYLIMDLSKTATNKEYVDDTSLMNALIF